MKPENLTLTLHAAELQYEQGDYEEALPRLHKLTYHHPESLKPLRLLAECHFLTGKHEQATRHYERMMAVHATAMTSTDWLHAAYNYWLQGQQPDCYRCMQRAEELYAPTEDEQGDLPPFADVIVNDTRILLPSLGTHSKDLTYLYDAFTRSKKSLLDL